MSSPFPEDFDEDMDHVSNDDPVDAFRDQLAEQLDLAFVGCHGPFVEQLKDVLFEKIDKYYAEDAYYKGIKPTIIEMIKNNI